MRPGIILLWALLSAAPAVGQQAQPPIGREAALALEFPRLDFPAPDLQRREVAGVPVLFLEDRSLPLVDVFAYFRGGYAMLDRAVYGAATALPTLLRTGGTHSLPPDSVDKLLELYAAQTSFGTGGGSSFATLNTLRDNLDAALGLWKDLMREPAFDSTAVEVWRGQELDRARRGRDDPSRLAFSEFNRIMFGDHPTGWQMLESDLEPMDLTQEVLRRVHRQIYCREHLALGVSGDVGWPELEEHLRGVLADWPSCPGRLPDPPKPQLRSGPVVFLIPRELEQSIVVLGQPGGVRRDDDVEYFASRIGNSILGGGGLSSRLMTRLRTEEGYAYGASSFWTAPARHQGIVGALTRTRPGATVAATRLMLEILREAAEAPPREDEVRRTVEEIVNGFVFNFETSSQVVSRQLLYLAQDLPADWLETFVEGVQEVSAEDVHRVMSAHVRPEEMVILLVGDPDAFDEPPEALGPALIWELLPVPPSH